MRRTFLPVLLSSIDRMMKFHQCLLLLAVTTLTFSKATATTAKPNPYDPISYECNEGEFIIQTRRNHSDANRSRPGSWKTACENEKLELDCGKGNTVRIIDVEYGRNDGSTCHYYPHFFMSCSASDAYHKVHSRCDNKQKCFITANSNEFGDPCPGIIKYLKVKHRCEPAATTVKTEIVCEHERKHLKCPNGTSLMISDASYGRTDRTTCPHKSIANTNCRAENVLDIVSAKCDHKQECDLSSANSWFGDPCKGTYKYLTIDYQCVVDDLQFATACDRGNLEIECKNSSFINVIRAEYGRTHPFICNASPKPTPPKGCSSPNEIAIVYGRCQGKKHCVVPATTEVFGEPCDGTPKYLELDYFCSELYDKGDSPGAPIIKSLTKDIVVFTSNNVNKTTSKQYKAQMKGADEGEWFDVMDGDDGFDFSEEHSIGGMEPGEKIDVRIVKKKDSLSACIPFTRFKTRQ